MSALDVKSADELNLTLAAQVSRHYEVTLGQDETGSVNRDYLYKALALTVRDYLVSLSKTTSNRHRDNKHVFYLSMEFLMGRTLSNAVHALGLEGPVKDVLLSYGADWETLVISEHDAGLGNGGLGRLAACFLDSCAALDLPVVGYGIRYEYGMFRQHFEDGQQVEAPDHWLRDGNPWELERAEDTRRIKFGGVTEQRRTRDGKYRVEWCDTEDVLAVPFDVLIPGQGGKTVNRLRLWKAAATDEFNLSEFHSGSYTEAVESKNHAENITMVLYPNDSSENGKALRLRQQYFLASASLQDVISQWIGRGNHISAFADSHVFQLNDTHPSCAVAELMRILLDDHHLSWDEAWSITTRCMAYTNHTLLPEALEKWSVSLFEHLLPRILEIIYEINERYLAEVSARWPGDLERISRMSLIEEGPDRSVRMAFLAIVGSFSVNGVAALHSKLLTRELFADFYALWPTKFNNKTNGVTPRRWLQHANAGLSDLVTEVIGDEWQQDLTALEKLADYAGESEFQKRWAEVRRVNKLVLAKLIHEKTGVSVVPEWLMDVQVKRIHEYKRQLLNALHIVYLYDRILRGDPSNLVPRTVLIGGKAAPGYHQAKRIIHFINCLARVINNDARAHDYLRVVFLPNYDVTAMEVICPATDLSEQISTAGKEASGTGNMKFMMNGALTIGTLDGANVEIRECVGEENFFLFGLTADEVIEQRESYDPEKIIESDADLSRVLELISQGVFAATSGDGFQDLVASIRSSNDPWMVAADFRSYIEQQAEVERVWQTQDEWLRRSILNTARSGFFSSDRTIREYADDIWQV